MFKKTMVLVAALTTFMCSPLYAQETGKIPEKTRTMHMPDNHGATVTPHVVPDTVITNADVEDTVKEDVEGSFTQDVKDYASKKYEATKDWFAQVTEEYKKLMSEDDSETNSGSSTTQPASETN